MTHPHTTRIGQVIALALITTAISTTVFAERRRTSRSNATTAQWTQGYTSFTSDYGSALQRTVSQLDPTAIHKAVMALVRTRGRAKVLTAGNGGSAANAEHMAHNITWDTSMANPLDAPSRNRDLLRGVALTSLAAENSARTNDATGSLAIATLLNDHATRGDVFVAFSGSGESQNLIHAFARAHARGIKTIAIARRGSTLARLANIAIEIDSSDQQIAEDVGSNVMHILVRGAIAQISGAGPEGLTKDFAHLRTRSQNVESWERILAEDRARLDAAVSDREARATRRTARPPRTLSRRAPRVALPRIPTRSAIPH